MDPVPFPAVEHGVGAFGYYDARIPTSLRREHLLARVCVAIMVLMLAVVLFGLRAAAFASPPDPFWLPGIYDGADGDDVVGLIVGTSASESWDSYRLLAPAVSSRVVWTCGDLKCDDFLTLHSSRSPPPAGLPRPHSWFIDEPAVFGAVASRHSLPLGVPVEGVVPVNVAGRRPIAIGTKRGNDRPSARCF